MHKRRSGILLPMFSLPSRYGIGCIDQEAYRFVDFLHDAGQSEWQMLPLGPTGYGDSPYQPLSAFALSPYYLGLDGLIECGALTRRECDDASLEGDDGRVDYGGQYRRRIPLLRLAYERLKNHKTDDYYEFLIKHPQIIEYARFMAIKDKQGGASWDLWPQEIRRRDGAALAAVDRELFEEIGFYCFLQYRLFGDFARLFAYAGERSVRIIGDLPIYLPYDSADVWADPDLFALDGDLRPTAVAGCPPDGFSPKGQLWGNPLYRWDAHADRGYRWWISRILAASELCDTLRIDHFRGFSSYYAIPYPAADASLGRWERGPGEALFSALRATGRSPDIIVEDLGFVDDEVRRLVKGCGYPNMRVLEFAFDPRDDSAKSEHLPHNYPSECVAYFGTHDNETAASWIDRLAPEERALILAYLGGGSGDDEAMRLALIALLLRSPAERCILTLQDWLGLDDGARINTPSTAAGNWSWRLRRDQLSPALAETILSECVRFGRVDREEKEKEER